MEDSSFARVVSVLFNPTKTFEVIRERPTWLVPLALLIVVSLTGAFLVSQKVDWVEVAEETLAAQNRPMSESDREQAIDAMEKFMPVSTLVGPLMAWPVFTLLTALICLVAINALGGQLSYKQSFSTVVHSTMPQLVAGLLTIPVVLGRDSFTFLELQGGSFLKSNLGAFATEETPGALRALMGSVDLFTLWGVVLLSLGLAIVGRLSKGAAAATAIGVWVLWTLILVGLASLQG